MRDNNKPNNEMERAFCGSTRKLIFFAARNLGIPVGFRLRAVFSKTRIVLAKPGIITRGGQSLICRIYIYHSLYFQDHMTYMIDYRL
jgi:hypothetical protein